LLRDSAVELSWGLGEDRKEKGSVEVDDGWDEGGSCVLCVIWYRFVRRVSFSAADWDNLRACLTICLCLRMG
jgi:hypothetical protein